MNRRGRFLARVLVTTVASVGSLTLLLGYPQGAVWGLAASALVWLGLLIRQEKRLAELLAWLDLPADRTLPVATGAWGEAFVKLSRRRRDDERQRQSIAASLTSFREAMDAVPDGLVLLDAEHRIQWYNRVAGVHLHLGGLQASDAGAIVEQLVRVPGFAEYLAHPTHEAPFLLRTNTERSRSYALRVVPLGEGQTLLVSIDVTDARRVETMRSEFVANVSHELRTPLTVVSGFLEHLIDETTTDPGQRQHFARLMSEQTARMLSLVDDLLTLSLLEADDAPASEDEVELSALLGQLLLEGESLSDGRHHFVMTCAQSVLRGNRKELHSAFGNLVSNAIRYTPPGGEIELTWSLSEGSGVFAVRDSGAGIAAEHLPRLTERFYRVDRGRSRETGGTGLGLAIVKHILLRHQARLEIESQLGAGSTFRAIFPAARLIPAE